jgi:hypothetical protein
MDKDRTIKTQRQDKRKWVNAPTSLNNTFAISNAQGHHVKDINNRMKTANEMFPSRMDKPF